MYIKELQLRDYRNYTQLNLAFDNQVNVIIGENAQGKTNLLEALYVLGFTKSYRTTSDRELIKWSADFAKVTGTLHKKDRSLPLEIIFHKQGKKAKINHLEQRKLSEYIGALNIVMFAPEDLTLVKGSPQNRRRYIDMEIGQIQPIYVYHLGEYQKVLKQRNHLLKQLQLKKSPDLTLLEVVTEQLVEHASQVLLGRFNFLKLLRSWAIPIHYKISRELENLKIEYAPSLQLDENATLEEMKTSLFNQFKKIEKNEIFRGTTLIGPHRDDLLFYINDKEVKVYGSQGQQRTTALALKLAEIDLIYNEVGSYPILLLDDVLSELDDFRQSHLLSAIEGKVQTFVSTTNIDGVNHETIKKAAIFEVVDGVVTKR